MANLAQRPCAACIAQTKQPLHAWPHQALRLIGERTFPGFPQMVRETDYGCQDCGKTIIHSTNTQECAWRCVTGEMPKKALFARRNQTPRH
jgi:hypothetical protein